jgi:hypothetical protein
MSNSPQNHDLLEELKATLESDDSQKNHTMFKAIVNALPAGALLGGFWESYVVSPATKRRDKFLETLVRELIELKSKIELVDCESPVFQTILMQACQIAIRTHKQQKLEALRNIILNSSIPSSIEDDVLSMFLNWIDGFTSVHISTLKHLHYWDTYSPQELHTYFPMLDKNRAIYNQVLRDLQGRGLISLTGKYIQVEDEISRLKRFGGPIPQSQPLLNSNYNQQKNRSGEIFKLEVNIDTFLSESFLSSQESKTTELGKEFVKFIEYPSS